MKNGIIGILCASNKVVDLKITNSLPMIALEDKSCLVVENQKRDISGFQHLSIPSDLCIHLTKRVSGDQQTEYVFFDSPQLQSIFSDADMTFRLLFTYVSPPINLTPKFQGKWEQAAIISPFPDNDFDSKRTRVFFDFIVHTENTSGNLPTIPFATEGMRLAYDRHGCIFGPYLFDGLQRKPRVSSDLFFSVRYGYVEMPIEHNCFVYIQYPIRSRGNAA